MNPREIADRQEAIRAELRGLAADGPVTDGPRGDLADELLDEYERLEARRKLLRRLRQMRVTKALRPGHDGPAGQGGSK
jgi:hypothetical protein